MHFILLHFCHRGFGPDRYGLQFMGLGVHLEIVTRLIFPFSKGFSVPVCACFQ
jgi:hypothetical protein